MGLTGNGMESEGSGVETYFARQPIFNSMKDVWGYELLYRNMSRINETGFECGDIFELNILSNTLTSLPYSDTGEIVLIHFTRNALLEGGTFSMPHEFTVVGMDEFPDTDTEALDMARKIKANNYLIAIVDFSGHDGCSEIGKLADFAFIDFTEGTDSEAITPLVEKACALKMMPAAKWVETEAAFKTAKDLGFKLFQGFFFLKPEAGSNGKLTSGQISRFNLFGIIERPDPDFDECAKIIKADVAMSYRLMTFINSAAFGFSKRITSVKQALLLLGWKQAKTWIRVNIVNDMRTGGKSFELPFLSAVRAKFLERTGALHGIRNVSEDNLFLLGLFSLLEPLLNMPIGEIVDNLPIDESVKAALCGEDNEYRQMLALATCFETGDWERLDEIAKELRLQPRILPATYSEAIKWARSFLTRAES